MYEFSIWVNFIFSVCMCKFLFLDSTLTWLYSWAMALILKKFYCKNELVLLWIYLIPLIDIFSQPFTEIFIHKYICCINGVKYPTRKRSMCKIYLKCMTYIFCINTKYIRKNILHTSSYQAKYIFPIFHDKTLYTLHIYFFSWEIGKNEWQYLTKNSY